MREPSGTRGYFFLLKYQCLVCGRVVSARLPHLHKNRNMGYCENLDEKKYSNFSDGPLID